MRFWNQAPRSCSRKSQKKIEFWLQRQKNQTVLLKYNKTENAVYNLSEKENMSVVCLSVCLSIFQDSAKASRCRVESEDWKNLNHLHNYNYKSVRTEAELKLFEYDFWAFFKI